MVEVARSHNHDVPRVIRARVERAQVRRGQLANGVAGAQYREPVWVVGPEGRGVEIEDQVVGRILDGADLR